MGAENEELHVLAFTNNLKLRLQDRGAKLVGTTEQGTHYGKKAQPCNYLTEVEASEVVGRNEEIVDTAVPAEQRWIAPKTFDCSTRIEHQDEIRMIADPMSMYPVVQAKAFRRKMDAAIIDAFFGSALTGENGTVAVSFPASQQIAVTVGVGSATGLNVDKLTEALEMGQADEWDLEEEEVHCAITARQNRDLMRQIEVIHGDYTRVAEVEVRNGFLRKYKGINFHHKEGLKLTTDGNNYRRIPIWLKSGMHFGRWPKDIQSQVLTAHKRGLPKRLYTLMTFNAMRLEEEKVIEVLCSEA